MTSRRTNNMMTLIGIAATTAAITGGAIITKLLPKD
jgi:hypothetical protein